MLQVCWLACVNSRRAAQLVFAFIENAGIKCSRRPRNLVFIRRSIHRYSPTSPNICSINLAELLLHWEGSAGVKGTPRVFFGYRLAFVSEEIKEFFFPSPLMVVPKSYGPPLIDGSNHQTPHECNCEPSAIWHRQERPHRMVFQHIFQLHFESDDMFGINNQIISPPPMITMLHILKMISFNMKNDVVNIENDDVYLKIVQLPKWFTVTFAFGFY
ncbi:hypothetical protein CEXT_291401 [Caerostris extrusa]|uniref:Uncharacterized protein n=1 Tax=Caerostris extrusa TaxID=172846 RepID=A0AAV4SC90_CAEEX|nr:hypothetical protein CEXT_291401 [Caerostris extrusa]